MGELVDAADAGEAFRKFWMLPQEFPPERVALLPGNAGDVEGSASLSSCNCRSPKRAGVAERTLTVAIQNPARGRACPVLAGSRRERLPFVSRAVYAPVRVGQGDG